MGKLDSSIQPVVSGNAAAQIEYWKHGINVSLHFNDMCIRLRILCLTVLATFFAAAAISMAQYPNGIISILWFQAHISAALYMIALIFICSLWLLDQAYYYKMLIASVENSEHVEPKVKALVYDLVAGDLITQRLTATIPRAASRSIANLFYGVQAGLTAMLFLTACDYAGPDPIIAIAPPAIVPPAITLGPPSSQAAEPLDLRGRAPGKP